MTTITRERALLDEEMLARFGQRAPIYDRENRFFAEDIDDLRGAGYLRMPFPSSSAASA